MAVGIRPVKRPIGNRVRKQMKKLNKKGFVTPPMRKGGNKNITKPGKLEGTTGPVRPKRKPKRSKPRVAAKPTERTPIAPRFNNQRQGGR